MRLTTYADFHRLRSRALRKMSHRRSIASLSYMPYWVKAGFVFGCPLLTPSCIVNRGQCGGSTDRSMSSLGSKAVNGGRLRARFPTGFHRSNNFPSCGRVPGGLIYQKWRRVEVTISNDSSSSNYFRSSGRALATLLSTWLHRNHPNTYFSPASRTRYRLRATRTENFVATKWCVERDLHPR